jgi:hypothetical protein
MAVGNGLFSRGPILLRDAFLSSALESGRRSGLASMPRRPLSKGRS